MVTTTKYDPKTDYAEFAITDIETDRSSLPTMTKGYVDVPRCCHGSFATDGNGNCYRLGSDNQWTAY